MVDTSCKLTIVIPVYNDWESLNILLHQIDKTLEGPGFENVNILVINDGSNSDHSILQNQVDEMSVIKAINIIHLSCNLGSQRGIATGLAYVANKITCDAIIVMDSDGEDRPEDILNLLNNHDSSPDKIIVAERSKRSETLLFRLMYKIYKMMFRYLTGNKISFGNFCLIPYSQISKLVSRSELWINLPATIIRSRLLIDKVPAIRGKRLMGKSSMNFPALIIHGLSAISVYSDVALVRILLSCLLIIVITITGMSFTFGTPLENILNIPEWLYDIGLLIIFISIQSSIIAVFAIFQISSNWAQNPLIPNIHYTNYIWYEESYTASSEHD